MKPNRFSNEWKGLGSPSRSILPAQVLQLMGFSGCELSTSPQQDSRTATRVSIWMSSGSAVPVCTLLERDENSWAEYPLRGVLIRIGSHGLRQGATYAWKRDRTPTRTSKRDSIDIVRCVSGDGGGGSQLSRLRSTLMMAQSRGPRPWRVGE